MASVDIEKHLESSYVRGLREVFRYGDKFKYDNNDILTGVIISSTYPSKDVTMKIPQIVVGNASYQFESTSLFNNFASDIISPTGNKKRQHATPVQYSIQMICAAEIDGISKDLSNTVANYINFEFREVFDEILKLNIRAIGKSPGGLQRQFPQGVYLNTVSVSGTLLWTGERSLNETILNSIKLNLQIKK